MESRVSMASCPVLAVSTFIPRRFEYAAQSKDVTNVVVNNQNLFINEIFVRSPEPVEKFLLLGR
jgi:hypothetical protein